MATREQPRVARPPGHEHGLQASRGIQQQQRHTVTRPCLVFVLTGGARVVESGLFRGNSRRYGSITLGKGEVMNKGEFVEMLADCLGESKAAAGRSLDCVLECLAKSVKKNKKVALSGFGTFSVKQRKARQGINPKTGAPIQIKASKTVGFKAAKALKDSL
jgi:DNA-binding protein HU-beta